MPFLKNETEIQTLEDWQRLGGPKRPDQWVDGRSAKELARAWLEAGDSQLPHEVHATLASHSCFGPLRSWTAEPEAKLNFDSFAGEPRNSDLLLLAEDQNGSFVIAVEAKADETFGEMLSDALAAAVERWLANSSSNGVKRIQQLAAALLGPHQTGDPALHQVRYQLLTASAGVLAEAERRGCSRAVLLIHEFKTNRTADDKHRSNVQDLDRFIRLVSHGAVQCLPPNNLIGPFFVPGAPLFAKKVQFFIGKAVRDLRSRPTA